MLTLGGLHISEQTHRYDTADEAHRIAKRLLQQGQKILSAYPMPDGLYPEQTLLVPNTLWRRLNAKRHLHRLVSSVHRPRQRLVSTADAQQVRPALPVWLKSASENATGWGYAVRFCATDTEYDLALNQLAAMAPGETVLQ